MVIQHRPTLRDDDSTTSHVWRAERAAEYDWEQPLVRVFDDKGILGPPDQGQIRVRVVVQVVLSFADCNIEGDRMLEE